MQYNIKVIVLMKMRMHFYSPTASEIMDLDLQHQHREDRGPTGVAQGVVKTLGSSAIRSQLQKRMYYQDLSSQPVLCSCSCHVFVPFPVLFGQFCFVWHYFQYPVKFPAWLIICPTIVYCTCGPPIVEKLCSLPLLCHILFTPVSAFKH